MLDHFKSGGKSDHNSHHKKNYKKPSTQPLKASPRPPKRYRGDGPRYSGKSHDKKHYNDKDHRDPTVVADKGDHGSDKHRGPKGSDYGEPRDVAFRRDRDESGRSRPDRRHRDQAGREPVTTQPVKRPKSGEGEKYAGKRDGRKPRAGRSGRDPLRASITDKDGSKKLKNLNASKASAAAFANASPKSNVGKIATYQEAAEDYYGLKDDLTRARRGLNKLDDRYDGRASEDIVDDLAMLDPDDPNFDAKRDALVGELKGAHVYETRREDLIVEIKKLGRETLLASKDATEAFYHASKGRALTKGALAELHANLGLPAPKR